MGTGHIIGEKKNNMYILTLNRPEKRNALSFEMMTTIAAEVEKTVLDPGVRSIIIKGEGKMFSAGVDFNSLGRLGKTMGSIGARIGAFPRSEIHKGQQWLNRLESIEIPIICAMHGAGYWAWP